MCFLRYKHFLACGHEIFLELLVCKHHDAESRTCCDIGRGEAKMTTAVKNPCLACIEAEMGQKVGYTYWSQDKLRSKGYVYS